jgi:hypothetical protein
MTNSDILNRAIIAVEEGAAKHGDTKRSFELIAQLWSVYIGHVMSKRKKVEISSFDVANMMVMLKQARSVYGKSGDNQVDIAGYAAIAAMLNPVESVDNLGDELKKAIEEEQKNAKAV